MQNTHIHNKAAQAGLCLPRVLTCTSLDGQESAHCRPSPQKAPPSCVPGANDAFHPSSDWSLTTEVCICQLCSHSQLQAARAQGHLRPKRPPCRTKTGCPEECPPATGGADVLGSRTTAPEGTSRAGRPRPDHPPNGAGCPSAAASPCAALSAAALPAPGRAVSAGAAWGEAATAETCLAAVVPVPLREVLCGRGSPSLAAASAAAAPPALPAGAEVGGLVSCVASSPAGGGACWCHWVCSVDCGAGGAAFTPACLAALAGWPSCLQKVRLQGKLSACLAAVAGCPSCQGAALQGKLAAQPLLGGFVTCRRCSHLAMA